MTISRLERFRTELVEAAASGLHAAVDTTGIATVVLVEGVSDRAAVEALARRRHRDLDADGVCVVSMGGVTSIRRFLEVLVGAGDADQVKVAGMYDAAEERFVQRAVAAAGFGGTGSREDLEALDFFVCDRDLEDELIRALGVDGVERVLATLGDLGRFRTFQRQPAQRLRVPEQQLHRFAGTTSGRKAEYARAFVEALEAARVPRPLSALLASI